jgi:hypothetical protein
MRATTLFALFLAGSASAQNWHVPDNLPAAGACNAVPFGASGSAYTKFQTRCTAADLGAAANQISGLGFSCCGSGRVHFDQIEIVLDHIPAAQALSTTFASNITPAAVTVLSASNYTWNVLADAWCEIGLRQSFSYNGVDDLVVQVTVSNGSTPSSGFHRGTRERIWWLGAAAPPPATGISDFGAAKIEVSMRMARTSSHGDACAGTAGPTRHDLVGSAQPGGALSFAIANGAPNNIAALVVGTTIGAPFPVALGSIGMPNCTAYTDAAVALPVLLDAAGAGTFAWTIPSNAPIGFVFYSQFVSLDAGANALGATTSNYGRTFVGN